MTKFLLLKNEQVVNLENISSITIGDPPLYTKEIHFVWRNGTRIVFIYENSEKAYEKWNSLIKQLNPINIVDSEVEIITKIPLGNLR